MGLFFKEKDTCCICNKEKGQKKINNGFVCKQCLQSCSVYFQVKVNKNTTKEQMLYEIERNSSNQELLNKFTPTKKILEYIEFDVENRLWLVPDWFSGKKLNPTVYKFDDIVEYELLENGESLTKGGIGRAVAGGVLFGGVGAIVGGVTGKKKTKSVITDLKIKIIVNDTNKPNIYIELIKNPTKVGSVTYDKVYSAAQEILSMFAVITQDHNKNENVNTQVQTLSVADEIMKLKELFDQGILTEEEFGTEKSKLLNK